MMLHEIYDKIMDVHEYYRTSKNEAWRNAVRHNLSVNECFIKVGKSDTGRGWVQIMNVEEICELQINN